MKASEIAKIEDVSERMFRSKLALLLISQNHPEKVAYLPIAWDVLNQSVTRNTIALANHEWKIFDGLKSVKVEVTELLPIVKLIANHNPDFQPGEEAFVMLDDMMKTEV